MHARTTSTTKPRMGTDVPERITIPNRIDTRLGPLTFFDGFPEDETVDRLYDNLDFQRGVQAFLTAMPAASLSAMRAGLRTIGVVNNSVAIFETLMDSRSLFLTANTESIYVVGWLDLKDGPLVVETPPHVLGLVDDFWFHYVADIGDAGPDRGEGGRFLFLPPGYQGAVPAGYYACRSRTFGNWLLIRGFMTDGDPAPAVRQMKDRLRIYPLTQRDSPPDTYFVNASGKAFNTIHATDRSYFEEVNRVVQEEPAESIDPETLGLLAALGIEKGKPFTPDARMRRILDDAAAVGSATARAIAYRSRISEQYQFGYTHYVNAFVGGSYEFLRNGARLLDPRTCMFFCATGITPAMAVKLPAGVGSQYACAFVDNKGCAFDGGRTYRLHLPPHIPARDFWSIVAYDTQTRSMLQTDQPFPSISSHKPGVIINPNTSVDVYFGPASATAETPVPAAAIPTSNWIQTIAGKSWFFALRLYGPLESWFDKSWQPLDVEELAEAGHIDGPAPVPQMAMPLPPSLIMADTITTPIGALTFFDGVPDEMTDAKVYDHLDFQRGVQAVLTTMPAASQHAMREGIRTFGRDNETVLIFENLMDSTALFLTGDADRVSVVSWLNLRNGPLVVESPPNTVGVVDDFWFQHVTDLGNGGPDGGAGGKYLFVPPGYSGAIPDGYFVCRSPTFNNRVDIRGFLVNGDPRPAVVHIRRHLKIYPLGRAGSPPPLNFVNVSGRRFNTVHAADFTFFDAVNDVVQEEPAGATDPETLGMLAAIGIQKGWPFSPDSRLRKTLTEAASVANATARALTYCPRMSEAYLYAGSAWKTAVVGGSRTFLRDGARLLDARTQFYFYASGLSSVAGRMPAGAGSQYALACVDSNHEPLDGGRAYRLHLPPHIPAMDFWSVVVYDNQTRSQLQTDQRSPSISSLKAGVVIHQDGSVDVYFGPRAPREMETNWIQTWPGKGWSAVLRLHDPRESWFDKSWRPGEIQPLRRAV